MFNAKKKRIKELEKTVAALTSDVERYKRDIKWYEDGYEALKRDAKIEQEKSDYKLGLVEQLMKQLTININMNGKKK